MTRLETFQELYCAARRTIEELKQELEEQRKYIWELEEQLEHCEPGLLKEVRESLEGECNR